MSPDGLCDRAFYKNRAKARSKLEPVRFARPCLLQKTGKGTVEIGACKVCATVPFAKKRQRHGRNCEADVVRDRAFYKKTSKARSESAPRWVARPCLSQKSGKGTVEIVKQRACATVPFAKKRQRHGRNCEADVVRDRAFYKSRAKARSKIGDEGRKRPCLLQKNGKGTVGKCAQTACATVPFVKKRQRHGQKVRTKIVSDRAFRKKM